MMFMFLVYCWMKYCCIGFILVMLMWCGSWGWC